MRFHRVFGAFIVGVLGMACSSSPATIPASTNDAGVPAPDDTLPPVIPVAENGVYALAGLERNLPTDDLAPLGRMVTGADIVGLGESIHTSGGFYAAKVRIIEYLVQQHGFRELAMESSWGVSELVNEYVQTCSGGADAATQRMNPIWWDTSVSELLAWTCAWNQKNPSDRVTFSGFDIRQPWFDIPAIRRFFDRVAPTESERLTRGLATCVGAGFTDEKAFFDDPKTRQLYASEIKVSDADYAACQSGVRAVRDLLTTRRTEFTTATSREDFERTRLATVALDAFEGQAYEYFGRDVNKGYAIRDAGMFEVFQSLRALKAKPPRVAVWAHNGHLSLEYTQVIKPAYPNTVTFGTLLGQAYRERYRPIGLVGYKVGINWFDGPEVAPFTSSLSIEKKLHENGVSPAFIDLTTPATAPLIPTDAVFSVGGEQMMPTKHFAGLVFIDAPAGASYIGGTSPFTK
jgi:erythromycin esterase-like protein